jgi:hypothetical protein
LDERLQLPVEQGVLLWAMRLLVTQLRGGAEARPRIVEMLDHLGAAAAASPLQAFMTTLGQGATRMIDVQCACRPRIGEDERALLDVLSLAQAIRPFEARLILRGFATPEAAVEALAYATTIGTILAQAGRFLPEPEEERRHFALMTIH